MSAFDEEQDPNDFVSDQLLSISSVAERYTLLISSELSRIYDKHRPPRALLAQECLEILGEFALVNEVLIRDLAAELQKIKQFYENQQDQ